MRKKNEVYTIKGFTGTIYEIANHFGINRSTIQTRIRAYGICDAIVKPVRVMDSDEGTIYKACGFKGNVLAFSVKFNISDTIIRRYLHEGLEMEEILRKVKRVNKKYKVFNFKGTLKEISRHFGIKYKTLWNHRDDKTLEGIITKHLNKMERKGIKCSEKLINEVRSYCKENYNDLSIQINKNREVK